MSTPFVHAFHDAVSLTVRVEESLYTEVSNHLIMVDYAAVGASPPTPWGWEVWSRFEPNEQALLKDLHCVLIHGLALQEYWLGHAGPVANWDELLDAVAAIPDNDLRRLVAESMLSGIQYYHQEMTPQPRIDVLLPNDADSLTADYLLRDAILLKKMAAANHLSWGVSNDRLDDVLAMVLNPENLRSGIYRLLAALRTHGSEEACLTTQRQRRTWIQHARGRIRNQQWMNASSAIEALTGRKPPVAEVNRVNLDEARELTLIPCSHLGSSQRVATIDSNHIVMFEPSASLKTGTATDQPILAEAVNLLRVITDGPAFSLVQSLANGEEKYALQLADDAQIHQSTVSRHLAMLERAGAVEVRPEGKAKYYRLNSHRIQKALTVVSQAMIPDVE
ncbi:MAG: helix-turn-helix domain-containing protein [Thermomicrobiales bacterium]|nr:helix-turn-helix domain-containing protein [Thermomicrobiales bacterium]MCO5229076.1 helix-turn-helix domain-containing protein [Thermomicrobiales bacterium]